MFKKPMRSLTWCLVVQTRSDLWPCFPYPCLVSVLRDMVGLDVVVCVGSVTWGRIVFVVGFSTEADHDVEDLMKMAAILST